MDGNEDGEWNMKSRCKEEACPAKRATGGALTALQILDADRQAWKKRAADAEALLAKAAEERDHWKREASRFQCDWARAEAKLADRADWSGVIAEKDDAIASLRGLVTRAEESEARWRVSAAEANRREATWRESMLEERVDRAEMKLDNDEAYVTATTKTPLQLAFSAMLREVVSSAEPFMEELFPIRRSAHALREALAEENPDALYADGFDEAFAGIVRRYGQAPLACYDRAACIQILMSESVDAEAPLPASVTQEEAEEYFDFNVIGAFMGPGTPVFIDMVRAPPAASKGEKP